MSLLSQIVGPQSGLCIPMEIESQLKHFGKLQYRKVKLSSVLLQQCVEGGMVPMDWSFEAGNTYHLDMWCMNAWGLIKTSGASADTRSGRFLWAQYGTRHYLVSPVMYMDYDQSGRLVMDGMIAHIHLSCEQSQVYLSNGIYWVERMSPDNRPASSVYAKDCIIYIASDTNLDYFEATNCIVIDYEDYRGSIVNITSKCHLYKCLMVFNSSDVRMWHKGVSTSQYSLEAVDSLIYELRLYNHFTDQNILSPFVKTIAVMPSHDSSLWSVVIYGSAECYAMAMQSSMALVTLLSIASTVKHNRIRAWVDPYHPALSYG
ncbi:MAG: hypothetical protein KatS3mg054_0021 [Chloroflexus sp.]|nr:MAG: hypothetical protein KatS3mg054_0021 [Chloroflexus sp.]